MANKIGQSYKLVKQTLKRPDRNTYPYNAPSNTLNSHENFNLNTVIKKSMVQFFL